MIWFEPMTDEDYRNLGKQVKDTFVSDKFKLLTDNLSSPGIFGKRSSSYSAYKSTDRDNTRGYIHLSHPVVNTILAGKEAGLLGKLLGRTDISVKDIYNFNTVWSVSKDKLISPDEAENTSDILCGAEILQMFTEEFNPATEAENIRVKIAKSSDAEEELKNHLRNPVSRLSLLSNLKNNNTVKAMITSYIAVIPPGLRPDIGNRHDPLSHLYANIISADKILKLSDNNVNQYISGYQYLQNSVEKLMCEEDRYHPARKPVLSRIAGKEGIVRGKMPGKRTDYSGHSVITIDPYRSIVSVGIPKSMAAKLYQHHLISSYSSPQLKDILGTEPEHTEKLCERLVEKGITKQIPVLIGRQPTLHRHSMMAFTPEITDTQSIHLNPLCVSNYNADFDGDQMWTKVFNSPEALIEMNGSVHVTNNLRRTETGDCGFVPRHEILYGLNICTKEYPSTEIKQFYSTLDEITADILNQNIKVSDTVTAEGITSSAGRLAVLNCVSPYIKFEDITEINSAVIKRYANILINFGSRIYISVTDALTSVGFRVANIYPPSLSVPDNIDTSLNFTEFNSIMKDTKKWYELGFEEETFYMQKFDKSLSEVEEKCKLNMNSLLEEGNGFAALCRSGARGSTANLVQIYMHRGNVKGNIIENSFIKQLTPLEHFCTAENCRGSLIAKSLSSAGTGYLSRQLWHASQSYTIVNDDCGTEKGILVSKAEIGMFEAETGEIDSVFKKIITGRYKAGKDGELITESYAEELCGKVSGIYIRSPLTCDKPCCAKCYGINLASNSISRSGLPVGVYAAHCVGRIGLQLAMDNFKKVGTEKVSNFDTLEMNINLIESKLTALSSYDPIARKDGDVIIKHLFNGKQELKIKGSAKSVTISGKVPVKSSVKRGEPMRMVRGDCNVSELAEYTGIEFAQRYLAHLLFNTYRSETEVNMKHFEVLIASMTMGIVFETDRKDLLTGHYHDLPLLKSGDLSGTKYELVLVPVKQVQRKRSEPVAGIAMEHMREGLMLSSLLGNKDTMKLPVSRMMFGKGSGTGKDFLRRNVQREVQ
jgi:DNA-directed RNA polymerase beta' subunit